eukprot:1540885-Amphidinium_carterae.1
MLPQELKSFIQTHVPLLDWFDASKLKHDRPLSLITALHVPSSVLKSFDLNPDKEGRSDHERSNDRHGDHITVHLR